MHFNCVVGYVVQGSNGEYAYMRPEEKIDLVRKVRELTPRDKFILAGSGCEGKKITRFRIHAMFVLILGNILTCGFGIKGTLNFANLSVFILPIHFLLSVVISVNHIYFSISSFEDHFVLHRN